MLIGMNVELGDTLASSLTTQSTEVGSQLSTVTNTVNTLLSSWAGNSRATFENEWNPWVNQVQSLISQMEDMQKRLSATIEALRAADTF